MSPRRRPTSIPPIELTIDLTMDEILEDLCAPGLPPGQWDIPGREHAHIDRLLRAVERGAPAAA